MSEEEQKQAQEDYKRLTEFLQEAGLSIAITAVSPSGAPVPITDFLPSEKWRVVWQPVRNG
jgi:hypothetical protein